MTPGVRDSTADNAVVRDGTADDAVVRDGAADDAVVRDGTVDDAMTAKTRRKSLRTPQHAVGMSTSSAAYKLQAPDNCRPI